MKYSLLKLRLTYHLSLYAVSKLTGVDIGDVARAELGIPIPKKVADELRLALTCALGEPLPHSVLPILTTDEFPENPTTISLRRIPGLEY